MSRQREIEVPPPPAADVDRLRLALGFFGVHDDPRKIAKKVLEGRWEFEVHVVGMPPVRVAGRTRDECLRDALRVSMEALRTHAADLRRRIELLTDNAADIERFVTEADRG